MNWDGLQKKKPKIWELWITIRDCWRWAWLSCFHSDHTVPYLEHNFSFVAHWMASTLRTICYITILVYALKYIKTVSSCFPCTKPRLSYLYSKVKSCLPQQSPFELHWVIVYLPTSVRGIVGSLASLHCWWFLSSTKEYQTGQCHVAMRQIYNHERGRRKAVAMYFSAWWQAEAYGENTWKIEKLCPKSWVGQFQISGSLVLKPKLTQIYTHLWGIIVTVTQQIHANAVVWCCLRACICVCVCVSFFWNRLLRFWGTASLGCKAEGWSSKILQPWVDQSAVNSCGQLWSILLNPRSIGWLCVCQTSLIMLFLKIYYMHERFVHFQPTKIPQNCQSRLVLSVDGQDSFYDIDNCKTSTIWYWRTPFGIGC